ncbi:hypothetical protein HMPREF3098_05255 [Corynebacterium sp. HMSC28B08]|nr:hypothetical protein HMPREF3098_05255 [Corynebacterium sp. HMSC28B08]
MSRDRHTAHSEIHTRNDDQGFENFCRIRPEFLYRVLPKMILAWNVAQHFVRHTGHSGDRAGSTSHETMLTGAEWWS